MDKNQRIDMALGNQPRGNYRLSKYNPRNALLFYADRYLVDPVTDPLEVLRRVDNQPESTWLTSIHEFKKLQQSHALAFQ